MKELTKNKLYNDVYKLLNNNCSNAYIESLMYAKYSYNVSLNDINETIEAIQKNEN